MKVRAALLREVGAPLEVRDDIELAPPGPGEVLVRIAASGVCHSDVSVRDGHIPLPVPMVLGHEGAGVIEMLGPDVHGVAVGDHVVLSFTPMCGRCFHCTRGEGYLCDLGRNRFIGRLVDGTTRFSLAGAAVHTMSMCGSFAERTVVPAASVVPIQRDVPLVLAALVGCGVLTGVGAAVNTAAVRPGERVVVVGCGGVGLNVVQGARLAGATDIIAVDPVAAKRELATRLGATATIDPSVDDPVEAVRALTDGRGADVGFEVVGRRATIDATLDMTRRGGRLVLVGVPDLADVPSVLERLYFSARTITACSYGSVDVRRDVPRLLDWHREGRLDLAALVSEEIALEQVDAAMDDLNGPTDAVRRVIRFTEEA
jgi:S-(hydroxymethyl)glutathione dehydrogenase/alcohol dehydrogenase